MSDKPFVFMTHICYGAGVRQSARQFESFGLGADDPYLPGRYVTGCSLLAHAFNEAWTVALNRQKAGQNIPYFLMLHDDIVPEDWFVMKLVKECEKYPEADMISCLVPLKDFSGNTSTAIDKPGDQYTWERRISLSEADKLPETFTAADCGYPDRPLLANTGCWICRFDRPWRHKVNDKGELEAFFRIDNRIHRHPNTGHWIADAEPEDWFFSRRLQQLGGKVMVTKAVKLEHWGMTPYPNYAVWGNTYDSAFGHNAAYTPIGEPRPEGDFGYETKEFPDVPGWLNDSEGRLLAKYAQGKKVLEVGSYKGRSTIWMARVAQSVFAVDTWDGRCTPTPQDTLPEFLANLQKYNVADKVTAGGGTLAMVRKGQTQHPTLGEFENPDFGPFDLIFIDGDHSEEGVKADIEESLSLLAPGGLMAFHDYARPTDPGVQAAVDELVFIKQSASIVDRAGTVIILEVKDGGRNETRPAGEARAEMCGTGPADCGVVTETLANGHGSVFTAVCSAIGP